jgi:hypothetical protein
LQQKCPAKIGRATICNRQNKLILRFVIRNELRQQYNADHMKLQGYFSRNDAGGSNTVGLSLVPAADQEC